MATYREIPIEVADEVVTLGIDLYYKDSDYQDKDFRI